MLRKLIVLAGLLLLATKPALAESSLVLDQPNPVYGQSITFTAVYPKEATRRVGTKQHWNPQVQVDCSQSGVRVFTQNQIMVKDQQAGDGMLTSKTYPIVLSGQSWTGGAASCDAALYYFGHDELIHVLAEIQFEAGA
jgi:hypothetical protein